MANTPKRYSEQDAVSDVLEILGIFEGPAKTRILQAAQAKAGLAVPALVALAVPARNPAPPRPAPAPRQKPAPQPPRVLSPEEREAEKKALADIAKAGKKDFKILAKNLKSENPKDSAFRVGYLVCYLRSRLLGEPQTPVKEILKYLKEAKALTKESASFLEANNFLSVKDGIVLLSPGIEAMAKQTIQEIRQAAASPKVSNKKKSLTGKKLHKKK